MITNTSLVWKYISNLFISIDQLGNVLAGGYADNTISSRIGYYNNHYFSDRSQVPLYWKILEQIIDFTFKPVDGPNHCNESYLIDSSEVFDNRITNFCIVFACIVIVVPSCVFIGAFLYLVTALGIVKQKTIDRNKNIDRRFSGCNKYVRSIQYEATNYRNQVNFENLNEQKEDLIEKINNLN
ncbi:hypothetical protein [Tenacibaculum sp. 190524A05c]|uniref:hypothetical protein n=1 Tax=Tenacibaculum platacis TaxID=3137852 RepID=UPI0032B237E7